MAKGPGLYTDIGKKARDLLLYKDYQSDQKFTIATYSPTGVTKESGVWHRRPTSGISIIGVQHLECPVSNTVRHPNEQGIISLIGRSCRLSSEFLGFLKRENMNIKSHQHIIPEVSATK